MSQVTKVPRQSKIHSFYLTSPGVLLTIPSNRNHHFLLYGVFNTARITLGVVGLPLTIPFTSNLFFILHGVLNRVRMILGDAASDSSIPKE